MARGRPIPVMPFAAAASASAVRPSNPVANPAQLRITPLLNHSAVLPQTRLLTILSDQIPTGARHEQGDYLRRVTLRAPDGRTLEIQIVHGSLVDETTDAIVNPANPALFNTISLNDVSFSILERGGDELKEAANKKLEEFIKASGKDNSSNILPIGHALTTPASGTLKSKYVIHAVGPNWSSDQMEDNPHDEGVKKDEQLSRALLEVLKRADELSLESISLPAVSTFLNGGSRSRVARDIFDTIINKYFAPSDNNGQGEGNVDTNWKKTLKLIRMVNSDELTSSCFCNEFDKREFANHPLCTHIHSKFSIPYSDLPQPDEADTVRNSPWLSEQ